MAETAELVRVRATVNLSGLPLGRRALVDPRDPYIADALEHGYLAREEQPEPPAVESEERAATDSEVTADALPDIA